PDGAVVAYAWKRQLAGQAGAAVDRTSVRMRSIVIPLHPIGSLDPDAVVFFQPTEVFLL
ncbi:hypothetical protein Tco_0197167, partial [Tanacetum coccineum]